MTAGRAGMLAGLGLAMFAAACGRKENPLPPLRPEPGRIADARLRRIDDRVEVRFTIPAANADGTSPSVLDRIEIYALATSTGAAPPTVAQVLEPGHLKGQVAIRHDKPNAKVVPGTPVDPRPAPGDAATFIDRAGTDAHGDDAAVLHYVVVGIVGKTHKGAPAGPFDVPIGGAPAAPQGLVSTYDEQQITFTWQPGAPGQRFRVYEVDAAGALVDPGHAQELQTAAAFSLPVVFDATRCVSVRAVREAGPIVIEGAATGPRCETPVDRFPPAAPAGLVVSPVEGGVELTWEAVDAKDLAGYVVLRGDGSGDKLLRLTTVPDLHYTDTSVTRGATYTYAVQAVDVKGNASGPSNRRQVTVRIP